MKKIIRKDSWRLRNPLKLTQTKWVEPPTQRTTIMTTLHADLCHFTGTEAYHRISLSQHVCTDGVNFLREQGNCYWLPEAIASHLLTPERCLRKYGEDFANFHIWTLTPKDGGLSWKPERTLVPPCSSDKKSSTRIFLSTTASRSSSTSPLNKASTS